MNIINIPVNGRALKASIPELHNHSVKGTAFLLGGLLADQLDASGTSRSQIFEDIASAYGIRLIRFNYTAHGNLLDTQSDGVFGQLSITRLIEDSCAVISYFKFSKIVMIGSSIGAGIMPFVASRINSEYGISTVGFFGVSALPPEALKAFVYSQMNDVQRKEFVAGHPIIISSPTLPNPIEVTATQFEDINDYNYRKSTPFFSDNIKSKFIVGQHDTVATHEIAIRLIGLLGGKPSDIALVDAPHDIPHNIMNEQFSCWIKELPDSW